MKMNNSRYTKREIECGELLLKEKMNNFCLQRVLWCEECEVGAGAGAI